MRITAMWGEDNESMAELLLIQHTHVHTLSIPILALELNMLLQITLSPGPHDWTYAARDHAINSIANRPEHRRMVNDGPEKKRDGNACANAVKSSTRVSSRPLCLSTAGVPLQKIPRPDPTRVSNNGDQTPRYSNQYQAAIISPASTSVPSKHPPSAKRRLQRY